ncbi:ATP dependent DNA ligase [Daedaleopsis nitida]|nr:ATP dependent DNA ligase [Daedaleopsis nitida]
MSLTKYRGCLSLSGPLIEDMARAEITRLQRSVNAEHASYLKSTPSNGYHITILTKDEMRDVTIKDSLPPLDSIDTRHIHFAGVGCNLKRGVFFLVVIWAAGQSLRKRVGLKPKQFHLTLSERDDHAIDKGVDALLPGYPPASLSSDPDFLDHLAFTFHIEGRFDRACTVALKLCKVSPESQRGFLRLGDAALKEEQFKLAMLAFACAFERCSDSKVSEYCLKRIEDCSKYTEWGCLFTETERAQLQNDGPHELLDPWSATLRDALSAREFRAPPTLCIQSREQMLVPVPWGLRDPAQERAGPDFWRLPRFVRWLVPFHVALMSTPRDAADISVLASPHLGIRHILTLTEETPLDAAWFVGKNIKNTFLPVPNYRPPTIEQMDLVLRMLADERNTPMLIHCGGGKGRAGTVAACYLVAYGFTKPGDAHGRTEPAMTANQAVAALRAIRPGSIETEQQEEFVAKYCSAIWKRHAVLPDLVPEPPPCPLETDGTLPKDADLFMLVGLPGSGKSTFARMLIARDPHGWTYVSQDETRSRAACETAIGNVRGGGGRRVLLDCCNVSRDGRKQWLALAAHWAQSPVCVWFDYERELCVSRAQNRPGHPTLPPGNRVRNAMDQMRGAFVRPEQKEGFKAILVVRSFAAAEELVSRLSPPITLFKFPRTPHLLDLGSATSDDIVTSIPALGGGDVDGARVMVTEKVDGANMGFSLSADRTQIVVQNRSHYVSPASHAQFRRLGLWVERHRAGLVQVLGRDPLFAQRYVLFGEWLAATHAIAYSRLPDWFMAFDLYDRSLGRWADRRTLEALLEGTEIRMVPVVHEGRMLSEEELRTAVLQPSRFYDSPLEGVYVKVERAGRVVARGKVVRADFISGNDHWSKGPLQLNALRTV